MAYGFTAASSQYLSTSSSPASGSPMTISIWARPTSSNTAAISVGVSGGTHRNQITVTGGNIWAATQVGVTTSVNANGTSTATNNTRNICGVFNSSTSRNIYVDGVSEGSNTGNIGVQNAADSIIIGSRYSTTLGAYYSGWIAEVGIWNAALTDAEIASLAKGMTCDKIRPQSLVFYAPLVRDLIDQKGRLTITNNNGATVASHPRVYA